MHVTLRVDIDHESHEGDDHQHDGSQAIKDDAEVDIKPGNGDPVDRRDKYFMVFGADDAGKRPQGKQECAANSSNADITADLRPQF